MKLEIDESCTDLYLNELALKTQNFSFRTIAALIDYSLLLFAVENSNVVGIKKVSKEYLDQAFLELSKQKEEFWDFSEHTTDEERRHQESLIQNAKHAQESKDIQIQIAEWSLLYQALMKPYDKSSNAGWIEALKELNSAKSLVMPDKKPAARVKGTPGKEGKGFLNSGATPTTYTLDKNNER